jgi:uracil-DNA glycosylase family 4
MDGPGQGKSAVDQKDLLPLVTAAVTTDEIYQRYLDKAIKEILRLEHEVAEAAGGSPVAQPTGHPLGTIFLVKYGPQAQELQEGVAFHGRAGHALKRSLERLKVDPREVFGTNCVKFAGADEQVCRDWLKRELRIVQPKLVVIMGEDALGFVNSLEFPLSRPLEARLGELQRFTPTIDALAVPDIDSSLDEQGAKTKYWNAFKPIGEWWAAQPPY